MKEPEDFLNQQLAEIDLLISMFPEELQIINPEILEERRSALEHQFNLHSLQESLDLLIKLDFSSINDCIELSISLPPRYPLMPAQTLLRSQRLSSSQHRLLSETVTQTLTNCPVDQLPLVQLIDWLRDNLEHYTASETLDVQQQLEQSTSSKQKAISVTRFARLWIYSHHIYNTEKRRNIVNWARDLGLTGFSKPGKPGIVCVEGDIDQTSEFWSRLRRLNWQRLSLKESQETEITESSGSIENLRLFPNFEEKCFYDGSYVGPGGAAKFNKMDSGNFFQWLQEKQCGDIFQVLFGIEGQLPKNASS